MKSEFPSIKNLAEFNPNPLFPTFESGSRYATSIFRLGSKLSIISISSSLKSFLLSTIL